VGASKVGSGRKKRARPADGDDDDDEETEAAPATTKPFLAESSRRAVAALLHHLECCHLHVKHMPAFDLSGNLHISVQRDRAQDWSMRRMQKERHKPFCATRASVTRRGQSLWELREAEWPILPRTQTFVPSSSQPLPSSLHVRPYFNSRLGVQLTPHEFKMPEHSYDVMDAREIAESQLEDIEDVAQEEVLLMKMWNAYIIANKPYGDCRMPIAAFHFVKTHIAQILDFNLRHNVLVHLINLSQFGLLSPDELTTCIKYIDAAKIILQAKQQQQQGEASGAVAAAAAEGNGKRAK